MLRWYPRVALVAIVIALATAAASIEVAELLASLDGRGFKW